MIDFRTIDELSRRLADSVPDNLKALRAELQANFREVLSSAFERMELVTRDEFDAQKRVLERLHRKVETLEQRLPRSAPPDGAGDSGGADPD